jgi:hypothetical protein
MWADRVGNKVLYRFKDERNILYTIRKKEGELDWSYLA